MILADKIINERKKNGWSQEELAEQLSVSRQSVSKWEGAQALPDLQKIIAMAEIFGVTTDYLLKDDYEPEDKPMQMAVVEESVSSENIRKVSLEEASDFLNVSAANAPKIANGVTLCVLSPVVLIFLAGLSDKAGSFISETVAATIGIITLLAMVAVAVYIFIIFGSRTKKYEYLEKERIETAYGVSGMVNERKKAMENQRTSMTALGVVLCIVSAVPLLITACLNMADYIIVAMVCVLLVIVSVAVNIFVRISIPWNSCNMLLQEEDYSVSAKRSNKVVEKIAGVYWGIVVAIYLGWSFITMNWAFSWIIWPIAAVLFGAIACVVRAIVSAKDE